METKDYIYVPPAATTVTVYAGRATGVGLCALEIVDDLKREDDEKMEMTLTSLAVAPGAPDAPALGFDVTTEVTITDDGSTQNSAISLSFPITF